MADTFHLTGTWSTQPFTGTPSGAVSLDTPFDEYMTLIAKAVGTYTLIADAVQAVSFDGLSQVHVVAIKTFGGKVTVRLTSADGTTQSVPVDSFAVLMSYAVPFTAIDVARVAGVSTVVNVFLGQHG